jgi:hypothetical protein
MNKVLGFMMVLLMGSMSFAAYGSSAVLLDIGILKFDSETEGNQFGNGKSLNTYYDLKIGYLTGNDLYLGAIYSAYGQDNGVTQPKRSLYGVTVGYHNSGWYLDGSYFLDGQLDAGAVVYKKGTGFGIDLGYHYMVNTNFFFGLQGSYKSYSFAEYTVLSVTTTSENKVKSEMYPMLVLGLTF